MRLGYLVLLVLLIPVISTATVRLELSADPDGNSCAVADPGLNQPVSVYVLVEAYYDEYVTGIRFAAPVPPASGLTHVGDSSSFIMLGSSQSDLSVAFGECKTGPLVALTMNFYRTSEGESCVAYRIQDGALFTDCYFSELSPRVDDGVALNCESNSVPIHNESPKNGATGVALTTELSWEDGYYICDVPLSATTATALLYFGTEPDPPYRGAITSPHAIGPLAPSTTFYWRVVNADWPSFGSPVWSFTTTDKVATQPTTWGAIKALYR